MIKFNYHIDLKGCSTTVKLANAAVNVGFVALPMQQPNSQAFSSTPPPSPLPSAAQSAQLATLPAYSDSPAESLYANGD